MTTSTRHLRFLLALWALLCVQVVVAQVPPIPPEFITASASSTFYPPLTSAQLTCDGSGLTGDQHHASPTGEDMWLSQAGGGGNAGNNPAGVDGPAWLLYEFNPPQQLERAFVWNHNQANLTDRGLRNIAIHYRDRSGNWHFVTNDELTRAPGAAGYAPGNEIGLGDIPAEAILVTASPQDGNYGSAYFGLSEIRFHGTVLPCFPTGEDLRLVSITIEEDYTQAFSPRPVGWLGSDVSYSIALDEDRLLWVYGDTFIGTSTNGKRDGGAAFINNSIAIQDISSGEPGNITFFWRPGNTSFFPHQPGTPGNFYWPTMGIMLEGELFIFSFSITTGGEAGFEVAGTTLLRVSNPQEHPYGWEVTASDFQAGSNDLTVHTGLLREGDNVYFLGSHRRSGSGNVAIIGRMGVDELLTGANGTDLRYFAGEGEPWTADPAEAEELFRPGVTESSLHYDAELGYYFALTYDVFGPSIYLTWAREITGPWQPPVCLYNVPEHDAVSFPIASYAARIQPHLSQSPGRFLISYATNSIGTVAPLFTEEGFGIYHPRFVTVDIAPASFSAFSIY